MKQSILIPWIAAAFIGMAASSLGADYRYTIVELPKFIPAAVNDAGEVAGVAVLPGVAALYKGGKIIPLGTLGGFQSQAHGINNRGEVVGFSYTQAGSAHAFLYTGEKMVDLTPTAPSSFAFGINDLGHVLVNEAYINRTSIYADGSFRTILEGVFAATLAINNHDEVAGADTTHSPTR